MQDKTKPIQMKPMEELQYQIGANLIQMRTMKATRTKYL